MENEIKHDESKHIFYAIVSDERCELKYKKVNSDTLDFYSTFVPNALRGQGIAGKVTAAALKYAKARNYKIIPSCPFVEKYIESHPEYKDLVA